MVNPILRICVLALAIVVLSMSLPRFVLAAGPNESGAQVTLNGTLHFVYGIQSCPVQQPNCASGHLVIPYLAMGDGENYVLLGGRAYIWPDGQRMLVTGWLISSTNNAPSITFAGDIIVTSIYAHCHMHN